MNQNREVLVAGLCRDPVQRNAGEGGGGGVSGAQGVRGDPGAVEAGGHRSFPEHPRDDVVAERLVTDATGPDPREHRAWLVTSDSQPGGQGRDGVGHGVGSVSDGDDLAVLFLVGLGSSDRDQEAAGLEFEVFQVQRDELGASHR